MPNDPATTPPASPEAEPPAPTPPPTPPAEPPVTPPAAPPADAPTGSDGTPFDPERAQRTIQELRQKEREGVKAAKERDELAARLQKLEDEKLTEEQKVARERDELLEQQETWKREKRDSTLKLAVYGKQTEMGIADADLAIAALDHSQVEWSDDGQPSNVEALLNDLLERKPLLKGQPAPRTPPRSDGTQGSGSQPPPDLTAEEAEFARSQGITPERYARLKGVQSIDDFAALDKTS